MDGNNGRDVDEQNAKYDLISGIVNRAGQRADPADRNAYYGKQLPKVGKFSLEDCIEKVLNSESGNNSNDDGGANQDYAHLRSFETVDFDALTRGFEPEEVKDGKLVLYITEKQLLQLLKQRAIIVPKKALSSHDFSKDRLSLVDEKIGDRLGSKSPVKEVELVVEDARSGRSSRHGSTSRPGSSSGHNNNTNNSDGLVSSSSNAFNNDANNTNTTVTSRPGTSQSNKPPSGRHTNNTTRDNNCEDENKSSSRQASRPSSTVPGKNNGGCNEEEYQRLVASQLARQAQKDGSSSSSSNVNKSRSSCRTGEQDLDNLKLVDSFVDRVIKSKQRGSSQSEQSGGSRANTSQNNAATSSSIGLNNRAATGSTTSGLGGVDQHAGSTGFAHAGGSTSFSHPDGSISHAGGSTSFSHAGGSTSFSHAGGSTSFSHPDGSTSFSHAGGSTSFSQGGSGGDAAGSTAFGTQSRGTGSTLGKESCGVQSSRNRAASGLSNAGDSRNGSGLSNAGDARNGSGLCNAATGSRVNGASSVGSSQQRTGSQQGPHKIIIKTIRNLPPKVTTSTRAKPRSECAAALHNSSSRVCGGGSAASATGSSHKIVKKTITYSYIDDYHPTTKVYEVLEPTAAEQAAAASQNGSVKDLFAPKSAQHNYLFKPFDSAIAESIGKPSTEQINKFLSIHNTGLKSADLVQIHPLINSKTDVRSKLSNGSQASTHGSTAAAAHGSTATAVAHGSTAAASRNSTAHGSTAAASRNSTAHGSTATASRSSITAHGSTAAAAHGSTAAASRNSTAHGSTAAKEPVVIDSDNYSQYTEDVSKHFGGLSVTDFPIYVQGLEFRQNESKNNLASSVSQSKTGSSSSQSNVQVVTNLKDAQYVKVNDCPTTA